MPAPSAHTAQHRGSRQDRDHLLPPAHSKPHREHFQLQTSSEAQSKWEGGGILLPPPTPSSRCPLTHTAAGRVGRTGAEQEGMRQQSLGRRNQMGPGLNRFILSPCLCSARLCPPMSQKRPWCQLGAGAPDGDTALCFTASKVHPCASTMRQPASPLQPRCIRAASPLHPGRTHRDAHRRRVHPHRGSTLLFPPHLTQLRRLHNAAPSPVQTNLPQHGCGRI